MLQPWQERVLEERDQLQARYFALSDAIAQRADDFDDRVLELLKKQKALMGAYLGVLEERIRLWPESSAT